MWLFFLFFFEFRRKLGEGGGIKFEFWWGVLIVRIGRYISTTMSLRGPAAQHLHNERAKRASLMGHVDLSVIKSFF